MTFVKGFRECCTAVRLLLVHSDMPLRDGPFQISYIEGCTKHQNVEQWNLSIDGKYIRNSLLLNELILLNLPLTAARERDHKEMGFYARREIGQLLLILNHLLQNY